MELPKRKVNRLPAYDYQSNGVYFITVCTADKQKLLWWEPGLPPALSDLGVLVDKGCGKLLHIMPACGWTTMR